LAELRCGCGSLLARLVHDHLELKCRRCKRAWLIPVTAG
jgi:phage FluMu protein Com